jgi:hypothetical protein
MQSCAAARRPALLANRRQWIAETAVFMRQAADIWTHEERSEFVDLIARNPEAGDVISDSREGSLQERRAKVSGT